jgi:hypothetical protein
VEEEVSRNHPLNREEAEYRYSFRRDIKRILAFAGPQDATTLLKRISLECGITEVMVREIVLMYFDKGWLKLGKRMKIEDVADD